MIKLCTQIKIYLDISVFQLYDININLIERQAI